MFKQLIVSICNRYKPGDHTEPKKKKGDKSRFRTGIKIGIGNGFKSGLRPEIVTGGGGYLRPRS